MTTDGTELSRRTRPAVTGVGGRFMVSSQLALAAEGLGLPSHALYLRGRLAPMGALTAPTAAAVLGIFPPAFVATWWERTAALSTKDAVEAFTEACAQWGRDCLGGVPAAALERLADLGSRVLDSAELSALPLVAAWRGEARPEEPRARAAFVLFLLRELRGAVHLGALRAQGLDVPVAVLTEPSAGEARLRAFAWRDADLTAVRSRAAAIPGVAARWAAAEESTEVGFGSFLTVLDAAEAAELVAVCDAVVAAAGG
jgi:hypothetical protein